MLSALGVKNVAHYVISNEHTQLNRVCNFQLVALCLIAIERERVIHFNVFVSTDYMEIFPCEELGYTFKATCSQK
jgi:hypothetical protein